MDSKPFDSKKLDVLLAAAKDFLGYPATSIILRAGDGGEGVELSFRSARITIAEWDTVLGHRSRTVVYPSSVTTEPNKNS